MSQTTLYLALSALLTLACAFDLSRRRIPNRLLAIGLVGALVLHLVSGPPSGLLTMYLAGFGVGLLMFLPLYLLGGMAAGDVKLMATVGALTGPALACQISLATYVAGGILACLIVLCKRRTREAAANVGALLRPMLMRWGGAPLAGGAAAPPSVGGMPYALAIAAGTLCVLWIRHT
jgi:prepilin peptidase CpaA